MRHIVRKIATMEGRLLIVDKECTAEMCFPDE